MTPSPPLTLSPAPCRILVVLENDMYVRNFVTSGALAPILARPDAQVVLSDIVTDLAACIPAHKIAGRFTRHAGNIALTLEWNILSMRALAGRCTTFAIKTKKRLYRSASRLHGLYPLLATPLLFPLARRWFQKRFARNASLDALLAALRPALVLFPITGVESTGTELLMAGKVLGFTTLFLVNGWDNLSSKGVFPLLPDGLGVWGPQNVRHAVDIQGMAPDKIVPLGCARYEPYFLPPPPPEADASDAENSSPFPFPYVLFAGATTACDELSPLQHMEAILGQLKQTGQVAPNLTVIYRPHPWREPRSRQCPDFFDPDAFQHIQLDPQVAEAYLRNKQARRESVSARTFPALSYYPRLLRHALFVVSPMSSMTLEAALMDVPTLVLAMPDDLHKIPPNLQAAYAHFEGGQDVPGWVYVHSEAAMAQTFQRFTLALQHDGPGQRTFGPHLRSAMRQFLTFDDDAKTPGRTYAQRLEAWVAAHLQHRDAATQPDALPQTVRSRP
jgi:hypothetical protein